MPFDVGSSKWARQRRLPAPPIKGDDAHFAAWADEVTRVLNDLPQFSLGTGDPNSQATADPGAFYSQGESSTTSSVWFKQVTSGNTGWVPIA
jgi:hypothetical protein